jgi:hypothetical protein
MIVERAFFENRPISLSLSVDESLVRSKTKSPNNVYLPMKPGKWGLLLRCANTAEYGYCVSFLLHEHGMKMKGIDTFIRLLDRLPRKTYNITCDNLYTNNEII